MSMPTGEGAILGLDIDAVVREMRRVGTDGQAIEAKSAAGGMPSSIASTVSAFANTPGGGVIILGLDERSGFSVARLTKPSDLVSGLASIARQSVEPPVQMAVVELRFEGEPLVVARVHEIDVTLKPCRVVGSRRAYLRVGDGDYELSRIEEDAFVVARARRRFDEDPIPGSGVADLDRDRVNAFLASARSSVPALNPFDDAKVLLKMGVLTQEGLATVAGLIALGEYPQQHLPAVSIRAALLPAGRSVGNARFLDDATFNGSIASMVEDAIRWVNKNSRNEIVEDRERGRVFNQTWPPLSAVRELVANAIVHRDLAPWSGGRAIELRMSSEMFRITNPGGLYEVSIASLGSINLTSARNRRLVEICRYVATEDGRVVEALATGIPTVIADLAKAGLPSPQFFDNGLSFTAIINARPGHETSVFTAAQTAASKVPPRLQAVIDLLGTTSCDVNEVAANLGISVASAAQRLYRMRKLGLVVSDGGRGQATTYRLPNTPSTGATTNPQPGSSPDDRPVMVDP